MRLATLTWVDVEKYLKTSTVLLLPIGSTEQHGPTGLLGTDHLTADAIALEVGRKMGVLVAPPVCYGMAAHHMAFPGSASISPETYQRLLIDLLGGYYRQGFRRFHVVNGHGGNEPSVRAVFQELKSVRGLEGATFQLYNWWKLPDVSRLAEELYGDREGFHATPSEVSLTFHLHAIAPRSYEYRSSKADLPWPMTAEETRRAFPDGTMRSDPGLARAEHGERFLKLAVDAIAASISRPLAVS